MWNQLQGGVQYHVAYALVGVEAIDVREDPSGSADHDVKTLSRPLTVRANSVSTPSTSLPCRIPILPWAKRLRSCRIL